MHDFALCLLNIVFMFFFFYKILSVFTDLCYNSNRTFLKCFSLGMLPGKQSGLCVLRTEAPLLYKGRI